MTFRLLACDGGGIRGYMSSLIIEALNTQTGGKLLNRADGFAGTSTGGLISVALADARSQKDDMKAKISQIVGIYCNQADAIFTENDRSFFSMLEAWLLSLFGHHGGPGVLECQYLATGLDNIAGQLVGDRLLGSIDPDLVLAVNSGALAAPGNGAKGPRGWEPVTFTNQPVDTGPGAGMDKIRLKDVALATSAAPSYFPPHRIKSGSGGASVDYGFFTDGGTFANNPIMNGIEVALASKKASDILSISAISVGTGDTPVGIDPAAVGNPLDWGFFEWIGVGSKAPYAALLNLTLSLSAGNETRIAKEILGKNVVRLNPPLANPVALDGHTAGDYQEMYDAVRPWIDFDPASEVNDPALDVWRRALELVNRW